MPTKLSAAPDADLTGLLGLNGPMIDPNRGDAHVAPVEAPSAGEIAFRMAENRDLRAEVDRLRAERDRLADTQRRIMELLGTAAPERLVHDLRNVLNERELYKALADTLE